MVAHAVCESAPTAKVVVSNWAQCPIKIPKDRLIARVTPLAATQIETTQRNALDITLHERAHDTLARESLARESLARESFAPESLERNATRSLHTDVALSDHHIAASSAADTSYRTEYAEVAQGNIRNAIIDEVISTLPSSLSTKQRESLRSLFPEVLDCHLDGTARRRLHRSGETQNRYRQCTAREAAT
jgi:hypothetical protein